MQSKIILLAFMAVTWIAVVESTLFLAGATGLVIAGLAALKGAALVGYAAGRHHRRRSYGHGLDYGRSYGYGRRNYHSHYRYGRSVVDPTSEEGENILLSIVGQLDPNGCILKLLCTLQFKEESEIKCHESILVDMFANSTETLTAYNAAFVYATDIGSKNQDPAVCDKYFYQCPLPKNQLGGLLYQAWGCGFDVFGDDTAEGQPSEAVSQQARVPVV